MAVTKIHAIRTTLGKAVKYICNEYKTDEKVLITSFGCAPETVEYDFRFSLSKASDRGKNLAYHLIQSFAPGETTGEEAHRISQELADRLLGGRYSYVLATHVDRQHIHSHIIFCAADNIDYKKYHDCKKTYYQIRDLSDKICAEHNKSVIKDFKETGKTYHEWYHDKKGDSWKTQVRKDINESIKAARTYEEFLQLMKDKGYEIHGETFGEGSAKYISFRPFGKDRFVRGRAGTLGANYTKERIRERIEEKTHSPIIKTLQDSGKTFTELVNIPEWKLAESIALSKYQDKENLKRIATMYAELGDLGLQSKEALQDRINELAVQARAEKRTVADIEKKIKEFKQILTFAKRYAENKKYGDNYEKSKDKDRYEREHDYQLRIYEGAKSWLKNSGIDPTTLRIKDIEEHLNKLNADHEALYNSFKAKEKEHDRLLSIQKSMQQFLDEPVRTIPFRSRNQDKNL